MQTLGLWPVRGYGRPATELRWPPVCCLCQRHQQRQPLLYLSLLCSPQQSASTTTSLLWSHAAGQVGPGWLLESIGHGLWRSGCRQRSRPPLVPCLCKHQLWLPMPVQMKPEVWVTSVSCVWTLFPASHSSLCSSVELQGEIGGAGTFAWLRLGCIPGWSQENRSSPQSALSTLPWEQASTHILLPSGAQSGFPQPSS